MTRNALLLLLLVLVSLTACGGGDATETPSGTPADATATPTRQTVLVPTPPPGWNLYSRSNYQIALPPSWQEVKLTDQSLKDAIAAAQSSNPPLAVDLQGLLDSGQYKSFAFYATDSSGSGIVRNVSIARLVLTNGQDIQTVAKAYGDALPNVVRGAQVVEIQAPLKVNGINAASFVYNVSLVDGAGKLKTLRGVQLLYLLDSGDAYLVTVNGDSADGEPFTALARQIATSFVAVTP